MSETPKEACGVFAVRAPGQPVSHLTYLGLYALQHRGQEAAGMAVTDGRGLTVVKDVGLVSNVFDDRTLAALPGDAAIGHTRYSTTGSSTWSNAQPIYRDAAGHPFALGHNGNLVNTEALSEEAGLLVGVAGSDSDVVGELLDQAIARQPADTDPATALEQALMAVLPRLSGAFSFVLLDEHQVIGVRDPQGFRPLCLGRLPGGGWVLASETPALDIVGATFVREVEPGELVVIDDTGVRSLRPFTEAPRPALCAFEYVYFARPDALLHGGSVHAARLRMGEALAVQHPVEADLVMGVPESALPAAEGYARASGIPYGHGLVKNRYIGRTFIAPSQELRARAVRMKLNPLRDTIEGRRLVVVDDSIVRGTTTRAIVAMLREAGAAEVHLRISSPPYRWPCFYGMDTSQREELLAANLSVDEIRAFVGADTLAYLPLDALLEATGADPGSFCTACLTGDYPVEVPVTWREGATDDSVLEAVAGG